MRLAAARFGVDPATVVASDGAVRDVAGGRAMAYEDLVRGLRLVERIDAGDDDALGGAAIFLSGPCG